MSGPEALSRDQMVAATRRVFLAAVDNLLQRQDVTGERRIGVLVSIDWAS